MPVYLGNPLGLVVTPKDGPSVYHMGDTAMFGDMALIQELYRPRIGIVPIGDRFTMGPTSAALACRKFFQFETIVPVHYATFPMLVPSAESVPRRHGRRSEPGEGTQQRRGVRRAVGETGGSDAFWSSAGPGPSRGPAPRSCLFSAAFKI